MLHVLFCFPSERGHALYYDLLKALKGVCVQYEAERAGDSYGCEQKKGRDSESVEGFVVRA